MRVPLRPRDLTIVALVGVFALAASGTHVVQSGETLTDVARDHDTSVRALVEANDLADPDLIVTGQELSIPGASGGGTKPTSSYVVAVGDTLGAIAARFGTTVGAIAEANDISDPNLIHAGTTLTVRGSAESASASGDAPAGGSSGPQLVGQRHTVQPGDTIAGIARRHGIDTDDLVRWNGLADGKIYATTRLLLYDPGSLPGTAAASGPQTHTVQPGENLARIASRYGSSARAIAEASGVTNVNRIFAGQRLTIPGGSGGGGVRCPVPGASFFNDWGFPRSGGRSHSGIDLFAPAGTPIQAPVSGKVDIAEGRVGGKQFRLTAPDGSLWFGSHMADFGATGNVNAGEVIGYVGDSGNARGARPHLHFEVHPGSEAVNPYPLLRSSC